MEKWDGCCHEPAKHCISVVPCLCWVWLTVVTPCLEQVSLEAHLFIGVKLKCCWVYLNGICPYKFCVLQTEAHFAQMHPVIVQLHPKPYIKSKLKKSETKAWLTYISGGKNKKAPHFIYHCSEVYLYFFKLLCVLHTLTSWSFNSVFCLLLVSPRSCFSIYSQKGTVFTQRWKLQNYMNWFC